MALQGLGASKPRIAVLSRNFSRSAGGAENYAVNLAEQVADQFEVHVFCERSDVSHPGITVHAMGRPLARPRWIALWLFAWWSWRQTRSGFAIVHSHENTWHGNVQTVHVRPMRLSLFSHIPSFHARLLRYLKVGSSPRLLAHLLLEWLRYRGGVEKRVVVVVPPLADMLQSTYAVRPDRLDLVPPGIAPSWTARGQVANQSMAKAAVRQSFGLAQEDWVLLLVGHNFEKKGLRAVLRSLLLMPADVSLLVVGGNSPQVETWRAECARLGLAKRVQFTGAVSDPQSAFAAADCLLHATLDDMFPLVVLESMAAQVPVVLSESPYCLASDWVKKAGAALMLENPHSEQQIVSAVEVLRHDVALREAQISRAQEFAALHTWPEIAKHQKAIYRKLLAAQTVAT